MKHDSINMTAPHTARELAQAESEAAGRMRAERIAQMICEDEAMGGADLLPNNIEKIDNHPTGDLISREAAIEAARRYRYRRDDSIEQALRKLPAAPAPQKGR